MGAHSVSAITQIEHTKRGISRQCSGTVDPLKATKPQSRSRPHPATDHAGSQAEETLGICRNSDDSVPPPWAWGALAPGRLRRLASISPQRLRTHFLAAHTSFSVLGVTGLKQGGGQPCGRFPGVPGCQGISQDPLGPGASNPAEPPKLSPGWESTFI